MAHDAVRKTSMRWETPSFTEIKMDAELAAYCDDPEAH
jgi:hypothetical protein